MDTQYYCEQFSIAMGRQFRDKTILADEEEEEEEELSWSSEMMIDWTGRGSVWLDRGLLSKNN